MDFQNGEMKGSNPEISIEKESVYIINPEPKLLAFYKSCWNSLYFILRS